MIRNDNNIEEDENMIINTSNNNNNDLLIPLEWDELYDISAMMKKPKVSKKEYIFMYIFMY